MRRGDVAVFSISAVLAVIVVAAVTFSVRVLDRTPTATDFAVAGSDSSWLVMTWGPTFCRTEPDTRGCETGEVAAMGRVWLLHGLWPQPVDNQYCGVPEDVADQARKIREGRMPPLQLDAGVRAALPTVMVNSAIMAPHEWYAHGTCSGVAPDVFFADAIALARQARQVLDPIYADAEGERMSLSDLRTAFDTAFGAGAGARVRLSCRNVTGEGSAVFEVHLSLPPVLDLRTDDETSSLKDLMLAAPPISPGCHHATVP